MRNSGRPVTDQPRHHSDGVVARCAGDLCGRRRILQDYYKTWFILLDDGCDVALRCLDCPLRRCRLDDSYWFLRALRHTRDYLVVSVMEGNGHNHALTAQGLGLDVRTVYRAAANFNKCADFLSLAEIQALAPLVVAAGSPRKHQVASPQQLRLL